MITLTRECLILWCSIGFGSREWLVGDESRERAICRDCAPATYEDELEILGELVKGSLRTDLRVASAGSEFGKDAPAVLGARTFLHVLILVTHLGSNASTVQTVQVRKKAHRSSI